jgi:Cupredoxin-like domain
MRWKLLLAVALLATTSTAYAQQVMTVTVKNHRFQPSQLTAPANVPISIRVRNQIRHEWNSKASACVE